MPLRWTQLLTEEIPVTCIQLEAQSNQQQTAYRIELPFGIDQRDRFALTTPGNAVVTTSIHSRNAAGGVAMTVVFNDSIGVQRIIVDGGHSRGVLYLPSASLVEDCENAIEGQQSAARSVLRVFSTPVQLPLVCGAFLDVERLVALTDTVCAAHSHAASVIHSFRYPIIRGALVGPTGLSVSSATELEELVRGFDSIETIGPVSLVGTIADVMLTTHESVAETERLLNSLGYELAEFERRDDDRFLMCYLAQAVVTDGVRSARGHVMQRRRHLELNYERAKMEARNSKHSERGRKWRRLVYSAARESDGEFVYVLANALYWTGHAVRSDSRMEELLYAGAAATVDRIDLPELEGWSNFNRHVAAGHRLRSCHQFSVAAARFTSAREIAEQYEFLPTWQPRYNEIVVQAHALAAAGNHEAAVSTIDTGIEELLQYNLPTDEANRVVRHLKGQQLETEAEPLISSDPQKAKSLLTTAREHYDSIGFTRSRDRLSQKICNIDSTPEESSAGLDADDSPKSSTSAGSASSPGDESHEPEPPTASEPSEAGKSTNDSPKPPDSSIANPETDRVTPDTTPQRTEPDSFPEPEEYPDLNDSLTPHDESKVGSTDIMSGPDTQQDKTDSSIMDERSEDERYR